VALDSTATPGRSLESFAAEVTGLLEDRQLLTHAFYQRWTEGQLRVSELTAYAEQYRHFERELPGFLTASLEVTTAPRARGLLADNLADETGTGSSTAGAHLELFDRFAAALDACTDAPATPATTRLVDVYREAAGTPVEALGVLVAYESQAAAIATTKASGLQERYGLDADEAGFWSEHASVDVAHRAWAIEALYEVTGGSIELAADALRRGADAWWGFLDEREAAAPVAA
jgi:pyrroloquinoline-quinone synthase